ncbi:DNA repair photolyase [Methyloglobulus morosus KoM1]|uniref:DNA repair photolyase n=1 Tax=Methyloglobulus morosus KoM1 TaxID=1116472 RepID=V5DI74_9GAMM|nr:PA0069 family radical SAM protein [Methyloglobulus morosus]ESS67091.1 DNA repair photolyase [Methyloglobulus morosus KoM1]
MPPHIKKGRGALSNQTGRFEQLTKEDLDDGWDDPDKYPAKVPTQLFVDTAKTVITYNQSPDVPFDRSINPYRGCEHGCVYCFARPSHAYLGLSPGLDFETKLFYKPNAPELLKAELSAKNYRPAPVALGINTDAYQPVERQLKLTRRLLEVLNDTHHPTSIVTKSSLIERDLDLLAAMAKDGLIHVCLSITTLNPDLTRRLEPRATTPKRRLQTLATLAEAGIPVSVLVAPLIPMLNDSELETILQQCRAAGALDAGYVLLRLPHELKDLFTEWLQTHEPLKADHVMHRIYDSRGGKAYDSTFGVRMRGTGQYADLLAQRFHLAMKKLAFPGSPPLNSSLFRSKLISGQLDLFDGD